MMATGSQHLSPEVLWAQRTDEVFITINIPDAEKPTIDLQPSRLHFTAKSQDKDYEVTLEFYKEIDVESSKQNVGGRNVQFILSKKEKGQSWWPRLLKQTGKPFYLKTDFSKWRDEDEDDEEPSRGDDAFNGIDLSRFTNFGGAGMDFGGMGGMGAMDAGENEEEEEDSDDEMPELEPSA